MSIVFLIEHEFQSWGIYYKVSKSTASSPQVIRIIGNFTEDDQVRRRSQKDHRVKDSSSVRKVDSTDV